MSTMHNHRYPPLAMLLRALVFVGLVGSLLLTVTSQAWSAPKVSTYEDAVVRVLNFVPKGTGTGTGFFVSEAGHLVTNHHVIDRAGASGQARYEVVYPRSGAREKATLVWADKELDLAVLLVVGGVAPATLKLEQPLVEKGTSVYAVGYPGLEDKMSGDRVITESTFTNGVIARHQDRPWNPRQPKARALKILSHSADITGGNSGGPLINDCSHVVGVNTQGSFVVENFGDRNNPDIDRTKGYSYASHISEAIRELQKLDIPTDVVTEVCELKASNGISFMSIVNTAAIVLLAAMLVLMFFKQSRQAVVQGAQRTIAKFSEAKLSSGVSGKSKPVNPNPVNPNPGKSGSKGSAGSGSGRTLVLKPANSVSTDIQLASTQLAEQKHGISYGRQAEIVDRVLTANGVSRRHFRISYEAGQFFIEDLNSANGTLVDGKRLEPYFAQGLMAGNRVEAGGAVWQVDVR